MVTGCEHDWRWLERPEYRIGTLGQLSEAVNVCCTRCGATAWAHGHGPANTRPVAGPQPTTERS